MRKAQVGDIVWYHPAIDDQRFHDKAWRETLPAVVTKVWDGVENLQVLPDLDLNVLQDGNVKLTFVPFVKHGEGAIGTWEFKPQT